MSPCIQCINLALITYFITIFTNFTSMIHTYHIMRNILNHFMHQSFTKRVTFYLIISLFHSLSSYQSHPVSFFSSLSAKYSIDDSCCSINTFPWNSCCDCCLKRQAPRCFLTPPSPDIRFINSSLIGQERNDGPRQARCRSYKAHAHPSKSENRNRVLILIFRAPVHTWIIYQINFLISLLLTLFVI